MNFKTILVFFSTFMISNVCLGYEYVCPNQCPPLDVVQKKICQEKNDSPFLVNLYEPNYIFPFYYSSSLPHDFYREQDKDSKKTEVSFKLSFKVPVVRNICNTNTDLYIAYTQLTFWQAYENSAYVRETDYTPEIFLSKETDYPTFFGWRVKRLDLGASHQSNGWGDEEERAWNRIYGDAVLAKNSWMIKLKPWYVINDASKQEHNPNIAHYLGYDSLLIAYKYHQQVFSIERTNLESGVKRGSIKATWSIPLTKKIKFYTQVFSGYGQSLTEYDRSTTSVGIGIGLNDWI